MKKALCILLCILLCTGLFGCSDDKPTLDIDAKEGSLGGLRIGMSFEEAKSSGAFDVEALELYNQDENAPFFSPAVSRGEGTELLGEDCSLDMSFVEGKLSGIYFEVNMYMDDRGVDFSQREEFFTEKADLLEDALREALGKPQYENKSALPGGVYPKEVDTEAVREMTYFIKDGKVLEDKITAKELTEYMKNADYDYAVSSFCAKGAVYSETDLNTNPDAGTVSVQLNSKELILESLNAKEMFMNSMQ